MEGCLMDSRSFDAASRMVGGGVSGRRSLLALGTAGLLAALAGPLAAEGKNNKRKANKKQKTRNKRQRECPAAPDLCAPQVQACVNGLSPQCEDDDEFCQAQLACCSELGACDFSGFLTCLFAAADSTN
jgi:hypothetical protein